MLRPHIIGSKNLTSVNLPILNIRNDISLGIQKQKMIIVQYTKGISYEEKKCILKNKGAQDIQFARYPAYFHIQYLARY